MCILLLSIRQHPEYPLIVAANRDEFYARPTAAAAFWDDAPRVLAGRDLEHGGTWLGITRQGRFAALTNFRDAHSNRRDRPSRGHLVSNFLLDDEPADTYLAKIAEHGQQYNGFSLIVGQADALFYYSNREQQVRSLTAGIYGLSNDLLNTPWPKVTRGKQGIGELLSETDGPTPEALFATLADGAIAEDAVLPDTGIGLERERQLSPLFITGAEYGTRSSTVLLIDKKGEVSFFERTFQRNHHNYTAVAYTFRVGTDRS